MFVDRTRTLVFYYMYFVVWAAGGIFVIPSSLFKSSARVKVLKTDNNNKFWT